MGIKIIYRVTNVKTKEVYIGATSKGVEARKIDHLQKANKGTGSYFQEAIATYGPEAFEWEQIDTANSVSELAEKEKKYVIQYNSNVEGYNGDSGGSIKKNVYQYSTENGKLLAEYNCLESAANAVNASRKSISNVCLGQNKSCKGFYWSYTLSEFYIPEKDRRLKKVFQFTLSGKLVDEFESVAEASKKVGISKTCISRVCRGEREQSGGFIWKYK